MQTHAILQRQRGVTGGRTESQENSLVMDMNAITQAISMAKGRAEASERKSAGL